MEFLYDHHIDHYDIKPENIVLNDIHTVRLIDFDCARQNQDGYVSLLGTVRYMAPEVSLYPDSPYSPNSMDVFSFGCMLLYCLYPDTFHIFPRIAWRQSQYDALLRISRFVHIPPDISLFLKHCFLLEPTDRISIPSFRTAFQKLCDDRIFMI
jgi:serine/threonine protein kinase